MADSRTLDRKKIRNTHGNYQVFEILDFFLFRFEKCLDDNQGERTVHIVNLQSRRTNLMCLNFKRLGHLQ